MLISELKKKRTIWPDEYKIILEICMLRLSEEAGYENLYKVVEKFKDFTVADLENKYGKQMTLNQMYTVLKNYPSVTDNQILKLKIKVFNYIKSHNSIDLTPEYIDTSLAFNTIQRDLKRKLTNQVLPIGLTDKVREMFKVFVARNSANAYTYGTGPMIAHLTHTFNEFFFKRHATDIYKLANLGGIFVGENEDGEELSLESELTVEEQDTKNFPEFKRVAYNILVASEELYKHCSEVYYDLWSRYKEMIVKERYITIANKIAKEFKFTGQAKYLSLDDKNFKQARDIGEKVKYRNQLFNAREKVIRTYERCMENQSSMKGISDTFNQLKEVCIFLGDKNGKDYLGVKNTENTSLPYQRFFKLMFGVESVKKLCTFLDANQIDPLTVPSEIFRDSKYFSKFNTFEEYMKLSKTTKQLEEDAKPYEEEFKTKLPSMSNEDINRNVSLCLLSSIENLRFDTIKELLDNKKYTVYRDSSKRVIAPIKVIHKIEEIIKFKKYIKDVESKLDISIKYYNYINNHLDKDLTNLGIKVKKEYLGISTFEWKPVPMDIINNYTNPLYLNIFEEPYKTYLPTDNQLIYNYIRCATLRIVIYTGLKRLFTKISTVTTDIRLIEVLEEEKFLINLPDHITSHEMVLDLLSKSEKSNINKLELCDISGDTGFIIDDYYPIIYDSVLAPFREPLGIIKRLREQVNMLLSDNFVTLGSVYSRHRETLKKLSNTIATKEVIANRLPALMSFMNFTKVKEFGYVFHSSGKPVTKEINNGAILFLHSAGYWVCPTIAALSITQVSPTDVFQ